MLLNCAFFDLGLAKAQTTSRWLGIDILSFSAVKFSVLTMTAAPHPLLPWGRVVEKYFKPSISIIFSISYLCFLSSAFCHTSHNKLASTECSKKSVLKFPHFGKNDRTLQTVTTGKWCATDALLALCLRMGRVWQLSLVSVSEQIDTLPSNWLM